MTASHCSKIVSTMRDVAKFLPYITAKASLGHFLQKPYYILGGEPGALEKPPANTGASFGAIHPYSYRQRVRLRSAVHLPQHAAVMIVALPLLWDRRGRWPAARSGGFYPLKKVVFGDHEGSAPLRHVHVQQKILAVVQLNC